MQEINTDLKLDLQSIVTHNSSSLIKTDEIHDL